VLYDGYVQGLLKSAVSKQNVFIFTYLACLIVVTTATLYFYAEQMSRVLGQQDATRQEAKTQHAESEFFVVRVIDGDTIELESGQKVRYIGIDTPEIHHPTKSVECFGEQAAEKNRALVEGKLVKLEKDVSEVDRYGRLLRYVYVDGVMVNELLVREGYARASSYPPDIKHQDLFREAESQAQQAGAGLWDKTICEY